MKERNEKVTIVTGRELRNGDKFRIVDNGIVWTVLDADPIQTPNSFRAYGEVNSFLLSKIGKYQLVNFETK